MATNNIGGFQQLAIWKLAMWLPRDVDLCLLAIVSREPLQSNTGRHGQWPGDTCQVVGGGGGPTQPSLHGICTICGQNDWHGFIMTVVVSHLMLANSYIIVGTFSLRMVIMYSV